MRSTLKPIIPADNKPHIVVFLGITLKTQKEAERKPAGSADSNLSIDAELKDGDGEEAQRKISECVLKSNDVIYYNRLELGR